MGMFDDLRCKYPLPTRDGAERSFQTKSLDCLMDQIEIREDGTIWREHYDTEDHSDPNAEGLMRFAGMATRVNKEWHPLTFTGEVRFYDGFAPDGWVEFSA